MWASVWAVLTATCSCLAARTQLPPLHVIMPGLPGGELAAVFLLPLVAAAGLGFAADVERVFGPGRCRRDRTHGRHSAVTWMRAFRSPVCGLVVVPDVVWGYCGLPADANARPPKVVASDPRRWRRRTFQALGYRRMRGM